MFDATAGINLPLLVTIGAVSNTDYRYLHARGLYVDYLEDKARAKLSDVIADNGAQGLVPDGIRHGRLRVALPAIYVGQPHRNCDMVGQQRERVDDQQRQPAGDRSDATVGWAHDRESRWLVGQHGEHAQVQFRNRGQCGVATLNGVDPTDNSDVATDRQPFLVGGRANAGGTFDVRVSGGGPIRSSGTPSPPTEPGMPEAGR